MRPLRRAALPFLSRGQRLALPGELDVLFGYTAASVLCLLTGCSP